MQIQILFELFSFVFSFHAHTLLLVSMLYFCVIWSLYLIGWNVHNKTVIHFYIILLYLFRPYLKNEKPRLQSSLRYVHMYNIQISINDTQTACSRFTITTEIPNHTYIRTENNLYRLNKCYFSFILNRLRVAPSSVTLDKSLAQMLDIIGCIFLPVIKYIHTNSGSRKICNFYV